MTRIVVAGVGRFTDRNYEFPKALSPVEMCAEACRRAERDTGRDGILKDVVAIGTIPSFCEMRFPVKPLHNNFPKSVACKIGAAERVKYCVHAFPGGNGPQLLVNEFAEMIAKNEIKGVALITGCEVLKTFDNAMRRRESREYMIKKWVDQTQKDRPKRTNARPRRTRRDIENVVNMYAKCPAPVHSYAMFENAYRARHGLSTEESNRQIGRMYSEFTEIASKSPDHSWYPTVRTSHEISNITDSNFIVSSPYTKNMCAIERVNQSAAILIMSETEAKRRDIPRDRWIYLHGCGDAEDVEVITLRKHLDRSEAMRSAYDEAFRSAKLDMVRDRDRFACRDLYSCFPIAVNAARRILGISESVSASELTVTGGLAFHGGPGNNYVSHSICAVVERLRSLGSTNLRFGLVGANGGFLTEHSVGIYSPDRPRHEFSRKDPSIYNPKSYGLSSKHCFTSEPEDGIGRILAWTVVHDTRKKFRNKSRHGIVIGEMITGRDRSKRFMGITKSKDTSTVNWLLHNKINPVGSNVRVRVDRKNPLSLGQFKDIPNVIIEKLGDDDNNALVEAASSSRL